MVKYELNMKKLVFTWNKASKIILGPRQPQEHPQNQFSKCVRTADLNHGLFSTRK